MFVSSKWTWYFLGCLEKLSSMVYFEAFIKSMNFFLRMNSININSKHCLELFTFVTTVLPNVVNSKWSQTAIVQLISYIQLQTIRNVTSATWNACTISIVSGKIDIHSGEINWVRLSFQHYSISNVRRKERHISQMMRKGWVVIACRNVNRLIIARMWHPFKECCKNRNFKSFLESKWRHKSIKQFPCVRRKLTSFFYK